ncbi:hypothetical protein [Xenorhabdus koppenhoeferi]|uniref:hypothetical protein n=1 Tax=Xenorhabdus koppenhoeferi TaxID=351659 RepID=UPI000B89B5B1|nr:hypothetical protein [Xenorhabdus koppenhoeferi]
MFNKFNERNSGREHVLWFSEGGNKSAIVISRTIIKRTKKLIHGGLVALIFFGSEVRAESSQVITADFGEVSLPICAVINEAVKHQEDFVSNNIELLPFISSDLELVSEINAKPERGYRPKQPKEGEVRLNKGNSSSHDVSILLILILNFFCLIFGVLFSFYISPMILKKRRRWMRYHSLKAQRFHHKYPDKYYPMPRKTFWQWVWF